MEIFPFLPPTHSSENQDTSWNLVYAVSLQLEGSKMDDPLEPWQLVGVVDTDCRVSHGFSWHTWSQKLSNVRFSDYKHKLCQYVLYSIITR